MLLGLLAIVLGCSPNSPQKTAADDTPLEFKLPFPTGTNYSVLQGNQSPPTHFGLHVYAYDFDMPERSVVTAAATGRVVEVTDQSTVGGYDPKFVWATNMIVLDHGDARFSIYGHLQQLSATVKPGDVVVAGQALALSGRTGMVTQPHLHFEVVDRLLQSIGICFVDFGGGLRGPRAAEFCESGPVPARMKRFRGDSNLPRDVFARNGIRLLSDLPGYSFRDGDEVHVVGQVEGVAARVCFQIFPRPGGERLAAYYGDVRKDGRFDFTFTLAKPTATWELNPSAYAFNVVRVNEGVPLSPATSTFLCIYPRADASATH
ncbi:MAG: M23 family metallopeptidase [Planctomycetes bacterium]|nr:M23 family metallopeptidase [Planctomycetota bacterium]MBI3847931.1 M23 family metallopeptidase [Planctomycetota bacterium]